MFVKICGITTIDIAQTVASAGADMIGFVFAPSKRRVTPEVARNIAECLPPSIKKVGVFVNETVTTMQNIAEEVGLDIIQLHGDETEEIATSLPYPIIKAFSVNQVDLESLRSYPCDYYLIDSPGETYRGGSGKTFNWHLLNGMELDQRKLILAGGLTAENVQQAIKIINPAGIDVSSGVETNGKKDSEKINDFMKSVRQLEK